MKEYVNDLKVEPRYVNNRDLEIVTRVNISIEREK